MCMTHEHASHHAYFAESRALFYRFLKTCTKYPHKVMSRIQRVAEYLMENIVFLLLSVILETLIPVARQTNNSSNLMMTCFGWEANAESFQVLHGRLWRSMDVWHKLRQCMSEIFAGRLFVTLPIHEMLSQALAENSGIISLMGPVYMAWETQAVKQVMKLSLVKRITRPYY